MSTLTLFTRKAPLLGAIEFDAVLEDTLEAEVQLTTYPIESGARVADHRIIQPYRWSLIGAVSNNPLKASAGAFAAGVLSNFVSDSGIASAVAGISAALTAGSPETRASDALKSLLVLMVTNTPFSIDANDITLKNMVITSVTRTKTPINENGLEFRAQLQELPTLDLAVQFGANPNQEQLRAGDPSQTQAAAQTDKGEKNLSTPTPAQTSQVGAVA